LKNGYIIRLKIFVFALCLAPLFMLFWKGLNSALGANPIEVITHSTGKWTLIFLLITLSITPLRKITAQPWLIRFRRMFGLYAFFYGCLHLMTWVWLDKFFDLHEMWADILKRRFITVGMTALLLMLPLAITSTKGWIGRLGGKHWSTLHKLIYISASLGVIHFLWLVKADKREPERYGIVLGFLLLWRVGAWLLPKIAMSRGGRPEGSEESADRESVTADTSLP
jgi:methionine sulfoxide reductase heme-binding subunit